MTTTVAQRRPETEAQTPPEASGTYPPHLLTVDRYDRMVEAGIFGEKEPIFLLGGRLVEKMTKGDAHNDCCAALGEILFAIRPAGFHVRVEQPVRLGHDGAPEPDFSVVRGAVRDDRGRVRRITSRDVALIVEVADSSLAADTGEVLSDYARAGAPVYWVVNVPGRRVEVYTGPTGPGAAPTYRERRDFGPGDEAPVVLDGREVGRVAVSDVLPEKGEE